MVEDEIKRVDYDFVRRMYKEVLKDAIANNLEIIVKPKKIDVKLNRKELIMKIENLEQAHWFG